MNRFVALAAAGLSASLSLPVAAQTYSDGTFNLGDYSIVQSLQVGTATVSQTMTGGNPGSALKAEFAVPASASDELGSVFYLNNSFAYDPDASGALSTITFSIDKNVDLVPPPDPNFGNGQSFLIYQGGHYYVRGVALPSAVDVYETATLTATAADFSLITDMFSGATDSTSHPDFAAGAMLFGFRNGFAFDPDTRAQVIILEDNFSVTVTPATAAVPEPETYAMLLAGLGFLGWRARHSHRGR